MGLLSSSWGNLLLTTPYWFLWFTAVVPILNNIDDATISHGALINTEFKLRGFQNTTRLGKRRRRDNLIFWCRQFGLHLLEKSILVSSRKSHVSNGDFAICSMEVESVFAKTPDMNHAVARGNAPSWSCNQFLVTCMVFMSRKPLPRHQNRSTSPRQIDPNHNHAYQRPMRLSINR